MNIAKLNSLKDRIDQTSYQKAHEGNATKWNWMGYVLQFLNILICFFGVKIFLVNVLPEFTGKTTFSYIVSLALITLWELLKRTSIVDVVTDFRRNKNTFASSMLGNLALALMLIVGSGFLAVRGANEITDRGHEIHTVTNAGLKTETDSISRLYEARIVANEQRVDSYLKIAAEAKRTLNKREAGQISEWQKQIETAKTERGQAISLSKATTDAEKATQTNYFTEKSWIFLLITVCIEVFILTSVGYVTNYEFTSFREITDTEAFRKFDLYDQLLNVYFQYGDVKVHTNGYSASGFEVAVRASFKRIHYRAADLKDFFQFLTVNKIIETRGGKRVILKSHDDAKAILEKSYVKI